MTQFCRRIVESVRHAFLQFRFPLLDIHSNFCLVDVNYFVFLQRTQCQCHLLLNKPFFVIADFNLSRVVARLSDSEFSSSGVPVVVIVSSSLFPEATVVC